MDVLCMSYVWMYIRGFLPFSCAGRAQQKSKRVIGHMQISGPLGMGTGSRYVMLRTPYPPMHKRYLPYVGRYVPSRIGYYYVN